MNCRRSRRRACSLRRRPLLLAYYFTVTLTVTHFITLFLVLLSFPAPLRRPARLGPSHEEGLEPQRCSLGAAGAAAGAMEGFAELDDGTSSSLLLSSDDDEDPDDSEEDSDDDSDGISAAWRFRRSRSARRSRRRSNRRRAPLRRRCRCPRRCALPPPPPCRHRTPAPP